MSEHKHPDEKTVSALQDVAHRLRINSIRATNATNSGHPTSCCSAAEIMSVLFFRVMRYNVSEPRSPSNDRFILSKGHAAPVLYSAWAEAGLFPVEELDKVRFFESDLEGHPTPRLNFVDVATGSLGQGLSCAAGMAYVGKYIDKAPYRVFCLVGDGESAEGSIWEAMSFASYYKLDNLVVIFDVNRLGQSQETMFQHDMDVYRRRSESFGMNTYVVDGHDIGKLCDAFSEAENTKGRPTCVLAQTFKGKSLPGIENLDNWHGKALGDKSEAQVKHLQSLIKNPSAEPIKPLAPLATVAPVNITNVHLSEPPSYTLGQQVATRQAYGKALVKLGKNNDRVVALDAEVKNSTFSIYFRDTFPDRFIECFIAEQNCVGVAIGAACRDRTIAFVSTFATFFTRAFDQIRMGAISQTNVNFAGSHVGVSIGEDGPSQMALEDIAMFRSVPGSTVFYPSDAVSCERAVELAANTKGVCFIRTSRPNTAVIYENNEHFAIGQAKIVAKSDNDVVTVVGAGVTLYEALKARTALASENVHIRVVDPFTVKPIDRDTLVANAKATGGRVVVVEDHYPEGGLGEAVKSALAGERNVVVHHLAVDRVPRSGKPDELIEKFGIDSKAIAKAVKHILTV